MKQFFRVVAVMALLSLFFACRHSNPDQPLPAPDDVTDPDERSVRGISINEGGVAIEMPSTSVFVKEDVNQYLVEYNENSGRLVFEANGALDAADIKVGDVLFSGVIEGKAPDGYLVRVTKITKSGSKIMVDTEPASIEEAFTDFSVDMSSQSFQMKEEDITVYDIFRQNDLTPAEPDPLTKAINGNLDFTKDDFFELKADKFKFTIGKDQSILDLVVMDFDEDYEKTKHDQVHLVFTLDYEFEDGVLKLCKDGVPGHIETGLKMKLGCSAGFAYKYAQDLKIDVSEGSGNDDPELVAQAKDYLAAQNKFEEEVEKKLMNKKVRLYSWNIPLEEIPYVGPALEAIFDLRLDLYFCYNLKLKGDFSIKAVIDKSSIDFHLENSKNDKTDFEKEKCWLRTEWGGYHGEWEVSSNLKGSLGVGTGVVLRFKKYIEAVVADKDKENDKGEGIFAEHPYAGFFLEGTAHVEGSFKAVYDYSTQKLNGEVKAKDYLKTEGYAETWVKFKGGSLWSGKLDCPNLTYKIPQYPEEWTRKFELSWNIPVPFAVFPEEHGVVQDGNFDLQWAIPFYVRKGIGDPGYFDNLSYSVYMSKDRVLVEQSSPQALVASGLTQKKVNVSVDPMETYYWKIVTTNGYGWDYESNVCFFDTGYDGVVLLNEPLVRFLSDNDDVMPEVRIENEGVILRTPSNIRALNATTELVIQDPEDQYHIETIDDLLALVPNLEKLNCNYNHISSIDLSLVPKLSGLACKNNVITSLDISSDLFKSLNCAGNSGLIKLDLSGCPNLKILQCEWCGIDEINLYFAQLLTDLFASGNHLSYLDVSRCPKLIRLDLYQQSTELLKLRLTQAQMNGFALFKRHYNMEFEYTDVSGIVTEEARNVTNHSAEVDVTVLDRENYTHMGVVYSYHEREPNYYSSYSEMQVVAGRFYNSFLLEGLEPDRDYYLRGFAYSADLPVAYGNIIHFKTGPRNPVPEVFISPDVFEFDDLEIGKSNSKPFTISNIGEQPLTYEIICPQDSPFTVIPAEGRTLESGASQPMEIFFAPSAKGQFRGDFIVRSNDPRGDRMFAAWGNAIDRLPAPEISISKGSIVFDGVYPESPATTSFVIQNVGDENLVFQVDSPSDGRFTVSPTARITLQPNESQEITVTFAPLQPGEYSGVITVRSNDPGGTRYVDVSGLCIEKPAGPRVPEPEMVDLGLSVKWASFNLGAESPEGYGYYYSWGEVDPKTSFSLDNYRYYDNSLKVYTRYTSQDGLTVLRPEDDAAAFNLGGKWRMPTKAEYAELINCCTHEWVTINGHKVSKYTSNINGESVYFPQPGCYDCLNDDGSVLRQQETRGYYWNSTLKSDKSGDLLWLPTSFTSCSKEWGMSVRAVNTDGTEKVTGVSFNNKKITIAPGERLKLDVTISPSYATNQILFWSSGQTAYVNVSSDGVVTGCNVGTTTVTVTSADGGIVDTCEITVANKINSVTIPDAVDLGLSVKWASFNLGATCPEDFGNYYAWGEVSPKLEFTFANYTFKKPGTELSSDDKFAYSKYGVDNLTRLETEDDAAKAALGGDWRMPTVSEAKELINNCTISRYVSGGITIVKLMSNINGNFILLPGAGGFFYDTYMNNYDTFCRYWTSELDGGCPYYCWSFGYFYGYDHFWVTNQNRYIGLPIRAVRE